MLKKLFIIALKICVSAGLIWYVLSGIDIDEAWAKLIRVQPAMVAVAAMLMLLQLVIGGLRWGTVLRAIDHPLPFWYIVRLFYVGVYFNQVLPGGAGGDGVRIYLTYKEGLKLRGAINGVILERVAAVLALVLLVGATMPFFLLPRLGDAGRDWMVPALLISVVAVIGGIAILCRLDRLPEALRGWRIVRGLGHLANDSRTVFLLAGNSLRVLVWSVVGHVNIALCVFVLASGLNLDVGLFDCIILMPPVLLVMTVPISIGAWGVRENAMVLAFGLVGMSQQSATVLGLLLGFMTLAIALPGGLIWLASRGEERSRSITDIDGELTATPPEEI